MKRRLAAAAVVATLVTSAACGGESAFTKACDGYSDLLATSHPKRGVAGGREVVIVHPDGTGTEVLTGPKVVATDPTFSTDGKKVAFVLASDVYSSTGPTSTHLAVIGVDGKHQDQITGTRGDPTKVVDEEPDWSPVGDTIVFTRRVVLAQPDPSGALSTRQIYVVEPGGTPRLLLSNAIDDQDRPPAWSPDGKRLAFVRTVAAWSKKASSSVWTADANGGNARSVADLPGNDPFPQLAVVWAPDGKLLSIASGTLSIDAPVRSIDLADGSVTAVAPSGAELVWSKDGTRLYSFTHGADGGTAWRLTTVRFIDGSLTDVRESTQTINADVDGLDVAACPSSS